MRKFSVDDDKSSKKNRITYLNSITGQTLREAGYSKFSGGEPNNAAPGEKCGAIYRTALLDDLWCDRPAAFICEKKPDFPPVCKSLPAEIGSEEHTTEG